MLELVTRETETPESGPAPSTPDMLLPRVAQGDQAAFAELYDQTAPRVLGLIKRLLKDHAQSEEVAQEVFLEIWQNATRLMLTMAHRRAVDRIRASQAGRDRDLKIGVRDLETDFDSVTESVEIRIEHERVERALGRLTELQRQAVKLAYYGGLSHSEVAKLLDVPIGTVKTRLRDGMIRLRDEMGVAS